MSGKTSPPLLTCSVPFDNEKVLTGYENGIVKLWLCIGNSLRTLQTYNLEGNSISILSPLSKNEFLCITTSNIYIYEVELQMPKKKIDMFPGSINKPRKLLLLHDNLLIIAGHISLAYFSLDVWDLESGTCIHKSFTGFHGSQGIELTLTPQNVILVLSFGKRKLQTWDITRSNCNLINESGNFNEINSMALLPTGEIAIGNNDLEFYKMEGNNWIFKNKIANGNIIDKIYPIGGYKLMLISSARGNERTIIKIWDYVNETVKSYETNQINLQNDRKVDITYDHMYSRRFCGLISFYEDKTFMANFTLQELMFPKSLAEVRKNSRILSQACRTGNYFFARLPHDIIMNIILLSGMNDMEENEKKVAPDIAKFYYRF